MNVGDAGPAWAGIDVAPRCEAPGPPFQPAPRRDRSCSGRNPGGVSMSLNTRHGAPFSLRPDMISQSRRHRRCPASEASPLVPLGERPHGPTEVVAVHAEGGHRLVNLPVLAERVG